MKNKIGIFIPCYNVEKTIRQVLTSFSKQTIDCVDQIVVVDNDSQDKTMAVLQEIQKSSLPVASKLTIIGNMKNYGLGGSQKIAYQYFMDNGFTHFMIVHGDNQGRSDEIAQNFLKIFSQRPDIDVIFASRFAKGADLSQYNKMRIFGNQVFNVITFLLTGHNISDAGTGIIFYRTNILKEVSFVDLTNSFQFNPELNILLYNLKNIKIEEVILNWGDSEAGSNIKALNYCKTLLGILINYRINKTFRRKTGWEVFRSESQDTGYSYSIAGPQTKPAFGQAER